MELEREKDEMLAHRNRINAANIQLTDKIKEMESDNQRLYRERDSLNEMLKKFLINAKINQIISK